MMMIHRRRVPWLRRRGGQPDAKRQISRYQDINRIRRERAERAGRYYSTERPKNECIQKDSALQHHAPLVQQYLWYLTCLPLFRFSRGAADVQKRQGGSITVMIYPGNTESVTVEIFLAKWLMVTGVHDKRSPCRRPCLCAALKPRPGKLEGYICN